MAFRDLFDSDRRSKDDLRSLIKQRDEQIAQLGLTISELQARLDANEVAITGHQISTFETGSGPDAASVELEIQSLKAALSDYDERLQESERLSRHLERQLTRERLQNSTSEVHRVRSELAEAQNEIKRLRAGTSEEVWNLKGRAERAEELVQERDFEFRNLKIRVTELEAATQSLKAENDKLKRNSVPAEVHHAECDKLRREAKFEKDQAAYHRKQLERSDRDLHSAVSQVETLQQKLESEKAKLSAAPARTETSLANPTVMQWLVTGGDPDSAEVPNGWLGRIGEGPWPDDLFAQTLENSGYEFWSLPDGDLRHLIVGRKGWTKDALLSQIDAVDGEPLRIYSQEMFIAKLMTGRDPFDSGDEALLLAFAKGHPALEFLLRLPDPWPAVCDGDSRPIDPVDSEDYGVTESPLHLLGYRVGATSQLTEAERRELLAECFKAQVLEFTAESSKDYRRKWGRGGSAQRLYRMAAHIKWLTDSLGKDPRRPQARIDWIEDLEWLKQTFHRQMKRRFQWP